MLFGGSEILNCLSFSMEEPLETRNSENHLELGFLLFNLNDVNDNLVMV